MRDIAIPRTASAEVQAALRQLRLIARDIQIPTYENRTSLEGMRDGKAAYYFEDGKVYRVTKIAGRLFFEDLESGGSPAVRQYPRNPRERIPASKGVSRTAAKGIAKEVVADAPLAPRVSLVEVIEVEVRADEVDTRIFQEVFNYEIGKSPGGKRFEVKWYNSAGALQARTPEVDPTQAPITVGWIPETPILEQGEHVGILRYKLNPNTSADFNFFGDITLGV